MCKVLVSYLVPRWEVGTNIIPTSQIKKLRHEDFEELVHGCTDRKK